jgi:5-methylcytosine-specific restriction protein A
MFTVGREYRRKTEIHDVYGGQRQGGISTPKNYPFIFIFTSPEGEQHGYVDQFHNGVFWYTGEGQVGDMKMLSGNRSILNHKNDHKTIHAFESTKKGFVRYIGSADCLGCHEEIRPDRKGNDRTVFVFHLDIDSTKNTIGISESSTPKYDVNKSKKLKSKSLAELREIVLMPSSSLASVRDREVQIYYRSEALKQYVILRSKGVCEGCGNQAPFKTKKGPYLECHHLYRLADGGPDHPENVVALCPNCHRRAHYAKDATEFNESLKNRAVEAEEKLNG